MRCIEVLPPNDDIQSEADVADAQLQAIKRQEQALRVRKAQAQAYKAQQKLNAARQAVAQAR
jgi:hypothetical protein